jgi:putative transposase
VFRDDQCCLAFTRVLGQQRESWPFKLVAYVLMPDHFHLIVNPRDGRIEELMQAVKSLSAREIVRLANHTSFKTANGGRNQVWQESFKAFPLWSPWMIWQKINYIHSNPLKAGLVKSVVDYRWSSYGSFYIRESEPVSVDKDWWWPDDVKKLSVASAEWTREMMEVKKSK